MNKKVTASVLFLMLALVFMTTLTVTAAPLPSSQSDVQIGGSWCGFFGGLGLGLSVGGVPEAGVPIEVAVLILC